MREGAAPTGSPGWLSEITPASLNCGCAAMQPQQLAGHVAGAAEHHCRDARALSLRAAAAPLQPSASITRSPSAAPLLERVEGRDLHLLVMISTPTWLSVAGPSPRTARSPKRSRSSFTPPQAATGSLADSTTPVSAARMSGHSRIASTP